MDINGGITVKGGVDQIGDESIDQKRKDGSQIEIKHAIYPSVRENTEEWATNGSEAL
jgi:hypothetical protein